MVNVGDIVFYYGVEEGKHLSINEMKRDAIYKAKVIGFSGSFVIVDKWVTFDNSPVNKNCGLTKKELRKYCHLLERGTFKYKGDTYG